MKGRRRRRESAPRATLSFLPAITSSVQTTVMDVTPEVNNNNTTATGKSGGKVTALEVKGPEEWLCVSRLPPDITQDEFFDMISEFGGVEQSFLVKTKSGSPNYFYTDWTLWKFELSVLSHAKCAIIVYCV